LAHSTLGWIQAYNLDWQAAEASQRKALSLEPGNATVQLQAGWLFAELGHLDEGLTLIDKAVALVPLQLRGHQFHALLLMSLGRYEDAEASYRKTALLDSGAWMSSIGWALMMQGKMDEAKKAIDSEPNEAWFLAYWYHRQGQRDKAEAVTQRLETQFADQMEAYYFAELHAFRGQDDLAFEWLDRALEKQEPSVCDIKISGDFRRLHGDPRYKAFLKKMKLPE